MYLAGSFLMFLAFLTVDRRADFGSGAGAARSAHPAAGREHEMNSTDLTVPAPGAAAAALRLDRAVRSAVGRGDDATSRRSVYLASQWR